MLGTSRTMRTPGASVGTMIIEQPWYACTSGFVTTMTIKKLDTDAFDENHLWPLITYSSPSSTAVVRINVGSLPATSGSVIEYADRIVPSSNGSSHCFFCCALPPMAISSALPESGALLPKMLGAIVVERPRISCINASLTCP